MTGACHPSIVKREKDTQFARLVMAHIDSDTIPFFWQCASPFVLFDEIFAPWTPDGEAQKIIEKMSRDDDHPGYSDHQIIARNAGVFTCAILIYIFLSSWPPMLSRNLIAFIGHGS
jgi:hypothetical protein